MPFVAVLHHRHGVLDGLIGAQEASAGDRLVVAAHFTHGDVAAIELLTQLLEPTDRLGLQPAVGQFLDPVRKPALEEAPVVGRGRGVEERSPLRPTGDTLKADLAARLQRLACHPKWEVRKAVAHAVLFLRRESFHAVIAKIIEDENVWVRGRPPERPCSGGMAWCGPTATPTIAARIEHVDRVFCHCADEQAENIIGCYGCGTPSAKLMRSPSTLRQTPVDSFQQVAKLRRTDRRRLVFGARPHEATALQSLGQQAHPLTVVPQHLDQPAALPRNTNRCPQCGSRLSPSCTCTARPSKPRRMSVTPLASHTRVSDGNPIIGPAPQHAAQRRFVDRRVDPNLHATKLDLDRSGRSPRKPRRHPHSAPGAPAAHPATRGASDAAGLA